MKSDRHEWSAWIAELRRAMRLSQEDFAHRVGVQKAAVCRWEKGTRTPGGAAQVIMIRLAKESGLTK